MKHTKLIIAVVAVVALAIAVGSQSGKISIPGVASPLQSVDFGPDVSVDGGSASCTFSGYVWACESCETAAISIPTPTFVGRPASIEYIAPEGTVIDLESNPNMLTITPAPVTPDMPGCTDIPHTLEIRAMDDGGVLQSDTLQINVRCCGV